MVDVRRFTGARPVVLVLVGTVVLLNLTLLAVTGPMPSVITPAFKPVNMERIASIGERIVGIMERRRHGLTAPLCFVIGMSPVERGVDPTTVEANDGSDCRYAVLSGSGGGMEDMLDISLPLLESALPTRLVILGVLPPFMGRQPPPGPPADLDPVKAVRDGGMGNVREVVENWLWIHHQRIWINHHFRRALYNGRRAIFHAMSMPFAAWAPAPASDPWNPPESRDLYRNKESDEFLARSWRWFMASGWFDAATQSQLRPATVEALGTLLLGAESLGARVLVVLMPTTSRFRAALPSAARDALITTVRSRPAQSVEFLDLSDAMPDDFFADYVHLNDEGRTIFSAMLGRRLEPWLQP